MLQLMTVVDMQGWLGSFCCINMVFDAVMASTRLVMIVHGPDLACRRSSAVIFGRLGHEPLYKVRQPYQ